MIVKERIFAQNYINNHLQAVRVYTHHILYLSVSRFHKQKNSNYFTILTLWRRNFTFKF
jgi:hypothetical protein